MSNTITINTPIGTKICKANGNLQGRIDEIESISAKRSYHLEIKLKKANFWEKASDYVIIDTGEKMEKVKLTKEEFIKRAINGERFELNGFVYYYDKTEENPFRLDDFCLEDSWKDINGENEFKVIPPKPKTKIIKEWMYINKTSNKWCIDIILQDDEDAKIYYKGCEYKPTGRKFEVTDE